ncbi:MAG: NUDIX domain-containing protein [Anaerolineae bacterium]
MKTSIVLGLLRSGDRVLFVKQNYGSFSWMLPGGHVRPDESLAQAMSRKFKEEVALEVEIQGLVALRDEADGQVAVLAVAPRDGAAQEATGVGLADIQWLDAGGLTALQDPIFEFDRSVALRALQQGSNMLRRQLWEVPDDLPSDAYL